MRISLASAWNETNGAPGRIRTVDLDLRRILLYPPELPGHDVSMNEAPRIMKCHAVCFGACGPRLVSENDHRQHAGETDNRLEDFFLVDHGCILV